MIASGSGFDHRMAFLGAHMRNVHRRQWVACQYPKRLAGLQCQELSARKKRRQRAFETTQV